MDPFDAILNQIDDLQKTVKPVRPERTTFLSPVSLPEPTKIEAEDKVEYLDHDLKDFSQLEDLVSELDNLLSTGKPTSRLSRMLLEQKPLPDPKEQKDLRVTEALEKLARANLQPIPVRIYINDANTFKTMHLTSFMTAAIVSESIVKRLRLEETNDGPWVLFELFQDLSIERPLRDWEVVTEVVKSWERQTTNVLLMRRYGYKNSLAIETLKQFYPPLKGEMYVEMNTAASILEHISSNSISTTTIGLRRLSGGGSGNFKKMYFELDPNKFTLSCGKRRGSQTQELFHMADMEVYTTISARRKAPTKYTFALKSSSKLGSFEDSMTIYAYFLCTETMDQLKEWVLAFRNIKAHSDNKLNLVFTEKEEKGPLLEFKTETFSSNTMVGQIDLKKRELKKPEFKERNLQMSGLIDKIKKK